MPRGRTYMIPEERRKEALSKVLICPGECNKVMILLESGDHNHDEFYCHECKISAPCFFRGDASVSMKEQV